MSIASVITGGFGQSVALIITDGYGIGAAISPALDSSAGSGKYKWSEDELAAYLEGLSSGWAKEAYEQIVEVSPPSVKKEAQAIVAPFAEDQAIDWAEFELSLYRAAMLFELYEQEILSKERDEEELLILLM